MILEPGETGRVVAVLGQAADRSAAAALVEQYRMLDPDMLLEQVTQRWDALLHTVQIATPDRALDVLMNRWLPYQVVSCRLWGRAGFYQAGGAFGFRDQLQDCLALLSAAPTLVREHLLRASARQFEAGDVQHWWHPPSGRGVRTRCVDDRLWLPFVVLRYLAVTGDRGLLQETVGFLSGRPVGPGEDDAHFEPDTSSVTATVYEHCARAIDASLGAGPHGLPLMGSGDWNDGMNRVGNGGRGESVWMAWFLASILPAFADLAREHGEPDRARSWVQAAGEFVRAVEAEGWDGAWYRRGYFDDGTPLGSATRVECRIDSLAQSWAVLSGAADAVRTIQAMDSATGQLVRPGDDLVLLFTPPFNHADPNPGYVGSYVPGLRENGGQYTHAAVWQLMAEARLGRSGSVAELLDRLNPVKRSSSPQRARVYRTEPYVLAADVASEAPNIGRGGWTWYTGAAGWLHQAVLEEVLGVRFGSHSLTITPVLPPAWPSAEVVHRANGHDYRVILQRVGPGNGIGVITVDGQAVEGTTLSLRRNDGQHVVIVPVGAGQSVAGQGRPEGQADRPA